jgi:hypothetical protein
VKEGKHTTTTVHRRKTNLLPKGGITAKDLKELAVEEQDYTFPIENEGKSTGSVGRSTEMHKTQK